MNRVRIVAAMPLDGERQELVFRALVGSQTITGPGGHAIDVGRQIWGPTHSRRGDLFMAHGYSVIEAWRRQGRHAFDYMQLTLTAWIHNGAAPALCPQKLPADKLPGTAFRRLTVLGAAPRHTQRLQVRNPQYVRLRVPRARLTLASKETFKRFARTRLETSRFRGLLALACVTRKRSKLNLPNFSFRSTLKRVCTHRLCRKIGLPLYLKYRYET